MAEDLRRTAWFERKVKSDPGVMEHSGGAEPIQGADEEETPDEMGKDMAFGDAFKLARKRGLKVFNWRGKKYTTELKKK
jgi:hypothetical protein